MNNQVAMQTALEVLECLYDNGLEGTPVYKHDNAITALREALAQPQVVTEGNASEVRSTDTGEPVAWMYQFRNEAPVFCTEKRDWADNHSEWKEMPLYATPPSVEAAIEATKEYESRVYHRLVESAVAHAIEATKEKAAKVCEGVSMDNYGHCDGTIPAACAEYIRSMK